MNQTDIQLNITSNDGITPLTWASNKGHTQIVKLLEGKERLLKAIVKKISEVKEKYKGKNLPPFLQATISGIRSRQVA